jgi:hypothetical protein
VDARASPRRQAAMLRLVAHFVDQAEAAAARGVQPERIAAMAIVRPIARMGEEVGEAEVERLQGLEERMEAEFRALAAGEEAAHAA